MSLNLRMESGVENVLRSNYSLRGSKLEQENITKILASLIPDEMIYFTSDELKTNFVNGVLFFADISGFTDLCEKYNALGKGGPSRISQVLNTYLGAMVQDIMSHNGDILKFSGDAFLALWKGTDDISMSDVIHASIDCALGIQRTHGTFQTDVETILKVRIALSCGQIIVTIINDSNFMILGATMLEVKELGNKCDPGEIIISHSLRNYLLPNEYYIEAIQNSSACKVVGIGPEWSPSTLGNQYELFDVFSGSTAAQEAAKEKEMDVESDYSMTIMDDEDKRHFQSYMLRPSLDYAVNNNLYNYVQKFVITPVIRAVELNEPLEYLTEMRHVVIVFINIVSETFRLKNIIKLCNETHKMIVKNVSEVGGILNKISMFDKDLMFLVVFGLRGFKDPLETQKALYCAKNLLDQLKDIDFVASVSIGVCSGKTYCGVVGHPVRREYTVIGRTVNKAARLMVAYPGMVSCDSQTFLLSQLQAKYFKLQPQRKLKGFKYVGPIYKFDDKIDDEEIITKEMQQTAHFPILGRQKEMEFFFFLLLNKLYATDKPDSIKRLNVNFKEQYYMIVVKGKERQGKTRLLNEIAYFAEEITPINKCSLNVNSPPFYLFYCIFRKKCKLSEKNVIKRTLNVAELLGNFKVPEFLCALNDFLDVRFEVTKYYLRLSADQELYVKSKMIKYLCVKAFPNKCLVTIDNLEFMSDESWKHLLTLLSTGLIFICAALGNYAPLSKIALNVLENRDIISIDLKNLHKLFQAGIICQFLNCMGIPLELEKYVHDRSHGNPGWIESFLITINDSKGFEINDIAKTKAISEGYVIPPYDLLLRLPNQTIASSSVNITESKEGSFIKLFDYDIEGWDIYNQTINDIDITAFESHPDDLNVCVLKAKAFESLDTDNIYDVSMLQTYDSLKVHEQQLLKCCAILGDSFTRVMLDEVMQNQNDRANALAIQRLFEIRVFCCGRAKYKNGYVKIDHYYTDPNNTSHVKCFCAGFPINPFCLDLPKYANCAYIRFRKPQFREMLYNLLTEGQANLYHVRAMWFLESRSRRCYDCGMGYFVTLMGLSNDDGMKNVPIDHTPSLINVSSSSSSVVGVESMEKELEKSFYHKKSLSIMPSTGASTKSSNLRIKQDVNIRTFVDNNLVNCECDSILISLYENMIEHCEESELWQKLMNALLEYATLCIKYHNIPIAFMLLEKATDLLEKKLKFEFVEPNWQIPLTKGNIWLLTGQLHIIRTHYSMAEGCLLKALKCYNLKFPKRKVHIKFQIKMQEIKQSFIINYLQERYIGSHDDDICTLSDLVSQVFSNLYTLYMRTLKFKKAYLASIWSMNEALRSNSNFFVMCQAYTNVMTMDMIYTRIDLMDKVEEMALNMCFRKFIRLEKHELEAVVKLYGAIFCRKCLCSNIRESLQLGQIVVDLNSPKYGGNYRWLMLPLMLQGLLFTYATVQGARLIQQSSYYKDMNESLFGPVMYYTLCIEFKIYTSYTIEPIAECIKVMSIKMSYYPKSLLSPIEIRYQIALWLWYLRKENWQSAHNVILSVSDIAKWQFTQEPSMIYVMLHVLEGLLLLYVKYIKTNDLAGCEECEKVITHFCIDLKEISKRLICIKSRYYFMQAYWYMINKRHKQAVQKINDAASAAKKCSNFFELDWIEHNKILWFQLVVQNRYRDNWKSASDVDVCDVEWENIEVKRIPIPFFTLPLPE